jgi:iron(III) transport system permease protein
MEWAFLRETTYQLRPAPDREQAALIRLGTSRVWFSALVGMLCFIIVVLPLGVLVSQSWSIGAYAEAISRAGDSLLRSVGLAVVGASVLTVTGFLSGYLIHTRALTFWRSVDSLTLFLFALPSPVIAVGLVRLWNRPLTNFVYATPVIILLGYLAQYTALPSRITVSTLAQIPPSMEEAAQVVGAGWFRRMAVIVAPLAKRGLVAAWLVGYIFCLRDTGITMIVYPPGQDTLPVRIFTLMANSPRHLIAALCAIMIAATLLPLGVLAGVLKKAQNSK